MKFLSQHHLYVNNTCTIFQGQKINQKKHIQNLPTCVVVKFFSLLSTLIASQRLKFLFWRKFSLLPTLTLSHGLFFNHEIFYMKTPFWWVPHCTAHQPHLQSEFLVSVISKISKVVLNFGFRVQCVMPEAQTIQVFCAITQKMIAKTLFCNIFWPLLLLGTISWPQLLFYL